MGTIGSGLRGGGGTNNQSFVGASKCGHRRIFYVKVFSTAIHEATSVRSRRLGRSLNGPGLNDLLK